MSYEEIRASDHASAGAHKVDERQLSDLLTLLIQVDNQDAKHRMEYFLLI